MKKIDETIQKYVEWVDIPKDEYDQAQSKLSMHEFEKEYKHITGSGYLSTEKYQKIMRPSINDIKYMVAVDTLEEIKKLREDQEETTKDVKTLKGIGIFFVVLTAISLILSIVSAVTLSNLGSMF